MKQLHLVHCVDTEGPLNETIDATFQRLTELTGQEWDSSPENYLALLDGALKTNDPELDSQIYRAFNRTTLNYCSTWDQVEEAVRAVLNAQKAGRWLDDRGVCLPTTWFAMDHFHLGDNPREKEARVFEITRKYQELFTLFSGSEMNSIEFHFHCQGVVPNPLAAAHSLANSLQDFHHSLATRVLNTGRFPTVVRPGFHSERQDLHLLFEQWFPFDFGNQRQLVADDGADERFGDWRQAPATWSGYHPDHRYVFKEGACNRKIFRCLNVGTRLRNLTDDEIRDAFDRARSGSISVLAFCQHDFRPMLAGIADVVDRVQAIRKEFPSVELIFSTAHEAARTTCGAHPEVRLKHCFVGNKLIVDVVQGRLFGSQPYLAMEFKDRTVAHDNFDVVVPETVFSYTFDEQTVQLENVARIAVGSAGIGGSQDVIFVRL